MPRSVETAQDAWDDFFEARDTLDIPAYNNAQPYRRGAIDNKWARLEASVAQVMRHDGGDSAEIELLRLLSSSASRSANFAQINGDEERASTFRRLSGHYNTLLSWRGQPPFVESVIGNSSGNVR